MRSQRPQHPEQVTTRLVLTTIESEFERDRSRSPQFTRHLRVRRPCGRQSRRYCRSGCTTTSGGPSPSSVSSVGASQLMVISNRSHRPSPSRPRHTPGETLTYALSYSGICHRPLACNAAGCDNKPQILLLQSIAPQGSSRRRASVGYPER